MDIWLYLTSKFCVKCASLCAQELYKSGARKIGVLGVPPVGCVPSQRTLAGGIERECVTLYNEAAMMLNTELSLEIQRLNITLPGLGIIYVDTYTPLLDMISRPLAYGNLLLQPMSTLIKFHSLLAI